MPNRTTKTEKTCQCSQKSQESRRSFSSLVFTMLRCLACSSVLHQGKGDQQGREWLKDWCHYVIPAHFRRRRMFIFHSSAASVGNQASSLFRYTWMHSGQSDATMHILFRLFLTHRKAMGLFTEEVLWLFLHQKNVSFWVWILWGQGVFFAPNVHVLPMSAWCLLVPQVP